jgi:thymidylate synthase
MIKRIKSDENSRQAVITIWDPLLDSFRSVQAKDVPCTTMIQFFIRKDKLVMHVTMRSNDAWWGTPHDWGQLSQLQLAMANVLDIEAGDYYHHAVSLHLYERDYDKADTLTHPVADLITHDGFGWPGIAFEEIQTRALGFMTTPEIYTPESVTEMWHLKQQKAIDET